MRTLAILLTMAAAVTMGADKPRSFYVEVRGSGQPMILIPGLSSSPEVWRETVDRYKGRYECHLITVAGFMGKPRIEAPFLETVQRDLAAYIREKKLNKPVLLGHSLGGFVALRIAAAEPNLPGKVVIVDSVPYLALTMNPAIKPEAAKAMGDMMRTRVLNAPSGGNINWVKGMATKPEDHERIAAWGNQSDPRAVGDAMYEMFTTDLREEIGAITAPTLVLGTWIAYKDYSTKEQVQENFRSQYAALKGVRVKMFDTARHFIMWDDPSGFFAELDGFIGVK